MIYNWFSIFLYIIYSFPFTLYIIYSAAFPNHPQIINIYLIHYQFFLSSSFLILNPWTCFLGLNRLTGNNSSHSVKGIFYFSSIIFYINHNLYEITFYSLSTRHDLIIFPIFFRLLRISRQSISRNQSK